ncbi:MAG: cache domain-containing protein [Helicobacteraceae bacterium]|jgi:hypothetical protein|nr:cache domain-containing protein [Helicobacteraceae bacterium]
MIDSSTFLFRVFATLLVLLAAAFAMAFYSIERQFEYAQYALEAKGDEMRHWLDSYQMLLSSIADFPIMRKGNDTEIAEFLQIYDRINLPDIERLIFVNSKGIGYYHDGSVQPLADRIYYKVIVADQIVEQMITNPYTPQFSDNLVIGIVRAVKDMNNDVKGALYVSISTASLGENIRKFHFSEGSRMWLLDRTGRMFAHSHDTKHLMRLTLRQSDEYNYKGLRENADWIVEHRAGNVVYYDPDGVKMVAFFTPVPNSLGWILGISAPYGGFAKTYYVYGAAMALAGLGMFIAFVIIHLMAKAARKRGKNSAA